MGFGAEEEGSGRDARATLEEEAIRKHLRPELLNRLTKVVHFKPLEMETAREILGKLVAEFNERLAVAAVYDRCKISGEDGAAGGKPATVADRRYSVRIALDESAAELVLREGFSKEYGARNLERVIDRLLGTLVADALLNGKIAPGQTLHLAAIDGRIQFCEPTAS
jgi:ATP-dependent Clp protease ATP-binding subunit ClpA